MRGIKVGDRVRTTGVPADSPWYGMKGTLLSFSSHLIEVDACCEVEFDYIPDELSEYRYPNSPDNHRGIVDGIRSRYLDHLSVLDQLSEALN